MLGSKLEPKILHPQGHCILQLAVVHLPLTREAPFGAKHPHPVTDGGVQPCRGVMETPTPTLLTQTLSGPSPGISLAGTTTYTERLQTCGCSTRGPLHSLNAPLHRRRRRCAKHLCPSAQTHRSRGSQRGYKPLWPSQYLSVGVRQGSVPLRHPQVVSNVSLPLSYPRSLLGLCGYPIVGQNGRFQFFNPLEIHPRNRRALVHLHPRNRPLIQVQ